MGAVAVLRGIWEIVSSQVGRADAVGSGEREAEIRAIQPLGATYEGAKRVGRAARMERCRLGFLLDHPKPLAYGQDSGSRIDGGAVYRLALAAAGLVLAVRIVSGVEPAQVRKAR
jgi:hypothetical protein